MKAGRLRSRITLQKYQSSRDDFGQVIQNWVDIANVWAEVKAVTGKELMLSQQEMSGTTIRVYIRYRKDIDTTWRIKYLIAGSQYLNIKAVLPDAKRTYLELLCEAGLNDG
ncbi:phage head closure protein [Gilliamella sp. Gris1-4]|jgi:SPP1 family predicted phage head-tail adaptor|uniref:phage head closure protein n=1 Tax=Gilliamella sp. Gris1-4 TaxID=3120244 RepID=UPI00080E4118|nr:phage head closure protein [Gilliamella apicola]OCG38541.1 head-tail adaptor [Gilliamella apicola]